MRRRALQLSLSLCAWCALLLAPAAFAAPSAEAPEQLPDVVVTAQKIEQTLEEVPASVSTVDGDFIRKSGATGFVDLQDYTPNVTIHLGHDAGTFAIRGFATPDTNPGFDPSVGAVVDGVYYGRSQFVAAFFNDLDRFEVLRGPQGTLFGKNSTAGVLSVVTQAPRNEFAAIAELQNTAYGDRSLRPVIQAPIGQDWSVRIAGNYSRGDRGVLYNTFLKRPEHNTEASSSRGRARYAPAGSPLALDLQAFTSHAVYNNNSFQFSHITDKMLALVQSYDPLDNALVDKFTSANLPAISDARVRGMNATIDYDLSGWLGLPTLKFTSISAVADTLTPRLDLDADFTPVNFIQDTLAVPSYYKQKSQELHLTGEGKHLFGYGHGFNFIVGGYLADSRFRSSNIFSVADLGAAAAYCNATRDFCGLNPAGSPVPGDIGGAAGGVLGTPLEIITGLAGQGDQSARILLNQRGRAYAVFGQFEHFFLPQWAVIGGLRWGDEIKNGDAHSHSNSQLIKRIAKQEDHDTVVERDERDLSPKLGLKWEADKQLSAYLTWSRGFKSGGFNALPLSPTNLIYEPEQANSLELGAKTVMQFLGGPLRASAAVFKTSFDNLQVSTFTGGNFVVLNAAAAVSRGFDLDLHWLTPLTGVSITANTGLADAYYTSYPNAPGIAGSGQDTQDLSGKRLSFAPRWTVGVTPAYQLPTFESLQTAVSLDWLYRGDRYLDVDLDPRKLQPATTIVNARLTLENAGRTWGMSVVAHNITDKLFADQAISGPLAPGNVLLYRTDRGRYVSGNLQLQF